MTVKISINSKKPKLTLLKLLDTKKDGDTKTPLNEFTRGKKAVIENGKSIISTPSKSAVKTLKNTNHKIDMEEVKEIYNILHKKYPSVIDSKNIKIFAIGMKNQIAQDLNISLNKAKHFCKWYCGRLYKSKIVENALRYNLQGEVTGKVTKEQAALAKKS